MKSVEIIPLSVVISRLDGTFLAGYIFDLKFLEIRRTGFKYAFFDGFRAGRFALNLKSSRRGCSRASSAHLILHANVGAVAITGDSVAVGALNAAWQRSLVLPRCLAPSVTTHGTPPPSYPGRCRSSASVAPHALICAPPLDCAPASPRSPPPRAQPWALLKYP